MYNEYLEELNEHLISLPDEEREMAVNYYTEQFKNAGKDNEAAVIEKLGLPFKLAKNILSEESDFSKSDEYIAYREKNSKNDKTKKSSDKISKSDVFDFIVDNIELFVAVLALVAFIFGGVKVINGAIELAKLENSTNNVIVEELSEPNAEVAQENQTNNAIVEELVEPNAEVVRENSTNSVIVQELAEPNAEATQENPTIMYGLGIIIFCSGVIFILREGY
ncbi:MAG: DUF1700 domain-containing protein [Oscillospiraceae bacterium]|nr:DUF1700 domain-containing protein [Oscillospiraceae bacterium]